MQTQPVPGESRRRPMQMEGIHAAFIAAWLFSLVFYFLEYVMRSAPSVMLPELSHAFGLSTAGLGTLLGLYYYTYAIFAVVAGAALDRWGAKTAVPLGAMLMAIGAALFSSHAIHYAAAGRLLQGAGSAFAFIAAVYLAAHGLPARLLATAIGITQCVGMLGGAAGQFAVAPLIHGTMPWEKFGGEAGILILLVAVALYAITPREERSRSAAAPVGPLAAYKIVLANRQTWLCGLCAGLLFLPTTVGDMTWGVTMLREGWSLPYGEAVNRAAMVPLGWVFGCPILGYVADRIHRRKPVILAGAALMLAASAAIFYLPPGTLPPYLLGLALGFGSGAAMIPYSIVKEVNPDQVKGSATGAMNFLVFVLSALVGPLFGAWLQRLSDGGTSMLGAFDHTGLAFIVAIVLAMVITLTLRETGAAPGQQS
jgi:MFS family permease